MSIIYPIIVVSFLFREREIYTIIAVFCVSYNFRGNVVLSQYDLRPGLILYLVNI